MGTAAGILIEGGINMSEMLEKIERLASVESITDPALIREIINRFLDLRYFDLAKENSVESFVPWNLTKGFTLDENKVSECTIREVLGFIYLESFNDWFDVPEPDRKIFDNSIPNTAHDCYMVSKLLCLKRRKNVYVDLFMKIDFRAFVKYLMRSLDETWGEKGKKSTIEARKVEIGNMYFMFCKYIWENDSVDLKNCDEKKTRQGFTIGDVLKKADSTGERGWMCGLVPLSKYAVSISEAYLTANRVFIDCIVKNLIAMNFGQLLELFGKFKTTWTARDRIVLDTAHPLSNSFCINLV